MKMRNFLNRFFLTISLLFFAEEASAMPAQVILIRHGEKPDKGDHLSQRGQERAAALAPFFLGSDTWQEHGLPVALYATKEGPDDKSYRAQETITPLSLALKLPILANYTKTEYKSAAEEILNHPGYEGKMVLVCWEHDNIPPFVEAFGVRKSIPSWKDSVFDQVWSVTFSSSGNPDLKISQQALMYGDSSP